LELSQGSREPVSNPGLLERLSGGDTSHPIGDGDGDGDGMGVGESSEGDDITSGVGEIDDKGNGIDARSDSDGVGVGKSSGVEDIASDVGESDEKDDDSRLTSASITDARSNGNADNIGDSSGSEIISESGENNAMRENAADRSDRNGDNLGDSSGSEDILSKVGESNAIGNDDNGKSDGNGDDVGDSVGSEDTIFEEREGDTIGDDDNAKLDGNGDDFGASIGSEDTISEVGESNAMGDDDDLEAAIGAKIMDGMLVTMVDELGEVDEKLEKNGTTVERRSMLLMVMVVELVDELITPGEEFGMLSGNVSGEDGVVLLVLLNTDVGVCEGSNVLEIGATAKEFDDRGVE
jgi:hypothetical protein